MRMLGLYPDVRVWVNPYVQFTNPAQAGSPFFLPPET